MRTSIINVRFSRSVVCCIVIKLYLTTSNSLSFYFKTIALPRLAKHSTDVELHFMTFPLRVIKLSRFCIWQYFVDHNKKSYDDNLSTFTSSLFKPFLHEHVNEIYSFQNQSSTNIHTFPCDFCHLWVRLILYRENRLFKPRQLPLHWTSIYYSYSFLRKLCKIKIKNVWKGQLGDVYIGHPQISPHIRVVTKISF